MRPYGTHTDWLTALQTLLMWLRTCKVIDYLISIYGSSPVNSFCLSVYMNACAFPDECEKETHINCYALNAIMHMGLHSTVYSYCHDILMCHVSSDMRTDSMMNDYYTLNARSYFPYTNNTHNHHLCSRFIVRTKLPSWWQNLNLFVIWFHIMNSCPRIIQTLLLFLRLTESLKEQFYCTRFIHMKGNVVSACPSNPVECK